MIFLNRIMIRLCSESHAVCSFVQVTTLRAEVARKDVYISELLDRLAIVECEVKEGRLASCALECFSSSICTEGLSILKLFGIRAAVFAVISQCFILAVACQTKVFCCEVWKNLESARSF